MGVMLKEYSDLSSTIPYRYSFDVSNLDAGIYTIQIQVEGEFFQQRIMIE